MTPVKQRVLDPDKGDCMPACVASMLNISLDDVPNFFEEDRPPEEQFADLNCFLSDYGFFLVCVALGATEDGDPDSDFLNQWEGYYIMVGEGGMGVNHAVIYQRDRMVHCPGSGLGLKGPAVGEGIYFAYFFVPKEICS